MGLSEYEEERIERAELSDLAFKYALTDALMPYIERAREWWKVYEGKSFPFTATFPIKDGPPGMYEKCTRSPKQSPIYGIQCFPLVGASYLKLPKLPGGWTKGIEKIVKDGLDIEEFVVMYKQGLISTLRAGVCLCLIPKRILERSGFTRWIFLYPEEILELVNGAVTPELIKRLLPYAQEVRNDSARGECNS